jgi:hypothetical protein
MEQRGAEGNQSMPVGFARVGLCLLQASVYSAFSLATFPCRLRNALRPLDFSTHFHSRVNPNSRATPLNLWTSTSLIRIGTSPLEMATR